MTTTVSHERRATTDVNSLRPEDLLGLDDEAFRAVVDADLRRHAPRSGVWLRDDLIAALRSPELCARWHGALVRLQKSVDGQLAARQADFDASRAALDADVLRMAGKLDRGEIVRDPDTNDPLSTADAEARLQSLKLRRLSLTASHAKARAGTMRFKTGVDDAALEARGVCERNLPGLLESAARQERDHFAAYARLLTEAIVAHRAAVMDDLGDDVPDMIDTSLWGALRPTTESAPQERGLLHATDAGRHAGPDGP